MNKLILLVFAVLMLTVSAKIDFGCTVLCTVYWACMVKSVTSGQDCNKPKDCDCDHFGFAKAENAENGFLAQ